MSTLLKALREYVALRRALSPPEGCKVIDISTDSEMLQGGGGGDYGATHYPAQCKLIGDPAVTLSNLISTIQRQHQLSPQVIESRFQKTKAHHDRLLAEWSNAIQNHLDDDPISPHRIAYELNKLWDEQTIWVNQTMSMRQDLIQGIFINKAGTFFANPSGHLGVTAGAAYGVALARPREKVIAMMGDGDFIFSNPSAVLWTCSHYQIPVLYLVFNNQCWGTEWPFILRATLGLLAERQNYEHVDLVEPAISFTKIAESMKVPAETIAQPGEAAGKLKWGLETIAKGKPALIEIQLAKYTKGPSSYRYTFKREESTPC